MAQEHDQRLARAIARCLEASMNARLLSRAVRNSLKSHEHAASKVTPEEANVLMKAAVDAYESGCMMAVPPEENGPMSVAQQEHKEAEPVKATADASPEGAGESGLLELQTA